MTVTEEEKSEKDDGGEPSITHSTKVGFSRSVHQTDWSNFLVDPNASIRSEGSMKAFVEFMVNKRRTEDQAKEAKQAREEEAKRIEKEFEEQMALEEEENKMKNSSNILSKFGVRTSTSDQTNDLMKLQYENLALKLDQVMSKMEDNDHKERQVVVDGSVQDHFGYTFIDCEIPRAHLPESLVSPDYAVTRSSTGQSEITNALFEHRIPSGNTTSDPNDVHDIAVSIHSEPKHNDESNR